MTIRSKQGVWALLALAGMAVTGWAQQTKAPEPGSELKIEGEVTSVSLTATPGPPTLTLKATDGKEYTVHFGPLPTLQSQGFSPKVGDKITVSGTACCEMDGKTMIHSKEITLAGKTFRTPMTPQQMMGPGMQSGCCGKAGSGMPGNAGGGCPGCSHHNMPH